MGSWWSWIREGSELWMVFRNKKLMTLKWRNNNDVSSQASLWDKVEYLITQAFGLRWDFRRFFSQRFDTRGPSFQSWIFPKSWLMCEKEPLLYARRKIHIAICFLYRNLAFNHFVQEWLERCPITTKFRLVLVDFKSLFKKLTLYICLSFESHDPNIITPSFHWDIEKA